MPLTSARTAGARAVLTSLQDRSFLFGQNWGRGIGAYTVFLLRGIVTGKARFAVLGVVRQCG